jgi:hypothetical protein
MGDRDRLERLIGIAGMLTEALRRRSTSFAIWATAAKNAF